MTSPVGSTVVDAAIRRARQSRAYREESRRLERFERLARAVIFRRAERGLSQQELADRIGTSKAAIARVEHGQHASSERMIARLDAALELDRSAGVDL